MAFRPHRFGRYIIVDPIAVGGMAEIYRARLAASKEGPDRVIVIKKVIANLSQNSEFIAMFEEEIKITVGLTHPNIIQIYDYGKVDDQYFMAMEYVEGKNLRQFVKRLADMKSMFSIDMSCYIISQICHALAYAHSYKDRLTGQPLGIVHRDISPQNVMISYDGSVKLFDFGIAKARSASDATRAGVIKGKPSYLSPEQINGEELDGKSDIFALGIVLWELLTAKRLFVADTDMGVLRLIQSAKIEPPSTFNPAVPQALDAIILKSLTRDKHKRYQNAEEFQRDLHKFLYSFNSSFNPADLSYYAQELFKTEIRDDRERLQKFLAIEPLDDTQQKQDAEAALPAGKKKELSSQLAEGLVSSTDFNREMMEVALGTGVDGAKKEASLEMAGNSPPAKGKLGSGKPPVPGHDGIPAMVTNTGIPQPSGPAASRMQITASLKKGAPPGVNAGDTGMVIPPWQKPGGSTGVARGTRSSSNLSKELDSGGSSKNVFVLMAVLLVGGVVAARQYGLLEGTPLEFMAPEKQRQLASPDRPVPVPMDGNGQNTQQKGPTPNATQGVIVLQSDIGNFVVEMNGQPVLMSRNQFLAPLNTPLQIQVTKQGYEPIRFQTKLESQAPAAFRLEFKETGGSGLLEFVTTPNAKLTFYSGDTKILEVQTPMKQAIHVGTYKVVIENTLIGYKGEVEVVVEDGKITRVEKVLAK